MSRDIWSVLDKHMPSERKQIEKVVDIDSKNKYPEGQIMQNYQGECLVVEYTYPLTYLYGGSTFGKVLESKKGILGILLGTNDEHYDIKDFVFFDTETTGLSSGAGTVIFLAGAGYFTDDEFILKQYFMRDYDDEPALLEFISELMVDRPGLVTFNGKAFDWNLMLGRYTSNRLKPKRSSPIHLDLLYPSRMLWKRRLNSCRLVSLEENILGEYRSFDIPGELIPSVYFDYLNSKVFDDSMKKVFIHNRLDILSMISLLGRICDMLNEPLLCCENSVELFGTGRLFEGAGIYENMIKCYERCMDSRNVYIKQAALEKLSVFCKRRGEYDRIVACWKEQSGETHASLHRIYSLIELAKYFEHKEKKLVFAIKTTKEALELVKTSLNFDRELFEELKKRMQRLVGKYEKLKGMSDNREANNTDRNQRAISCK